MQYVMLVAILVGPIMAVLATRWLDRRHELQTRKTEIFKTLMRTRRTPTNHEHVGALNLIEIEFANHTNVITAWKALFEHFATEHTRRQNEIINPSGESEVNQDHESRFNNRLFDERQILLAKLLHAIAKVLNFKIEQLEIFRGGYLPQGWVDTELEAMQMRKFAFRLASGQSQLPVAVLDYTNLSSAEGKPTE